MAANASPSTTGNTANGVLLYSSVPALDSLCEPLRFRHSHPTPPAATAGGDPPEVRECCCCEATVAGENSRNDDIDDGHQRAAFAAPNLFVRGILRGQASLRTSLEALQDTLGVYTLPVLFLSSGLFGAIVGRCTYKCRIAKLASHATAQKSTVTSHSRSLPSMKNTSSFSARSSSSNSSPPSSLPSSPASRPSVRRPLFQLLSFATSSFVPSLSSRTRHHFCSPLPPAAAATSAAATPAAANTVPAAAAAVDGSPLAAIPSATLSATAITSDTLACHSPPSFAAALAAGSFYNSAAAAAAGISSSRADSVLASSPAAACAPAPATSPAAAAAAASSLLRREPPPHLSAPSPPAASAAAMSAHHAAAEVSLGTTAASQPVNITATAAALPPLLHEQQQQQHIEQRRMLHRRTEGDQHQEEHPDIHVEKSEEDDSSDEEDNVRLPGLYSAGDAAGGRLVSATDILTPTEIATVFLLPAALLSSAFAAVWLYLKTACELEDAGHFMETLRWLKGVGPSPYPRRRRDSSAGTSEADLLSANNTSVEA